MQFQTAVSTDGRTVKRQANIIKALAHGTRVGILRELAVAGSSEQRQALSPVQLTRRLYPGQVAEQLGSVAYHTRQLQQLGMIKAAGTRQVRGTVEHYYRLTARGDEAVALAEQLHLAV